MLVHRAVLVTRSYWNHAPFQEFVWLPTRAFLPLAAGFAHLMYVSRMPTLKNIAGGISGCILGWFVFQWLLPAASEHRFARELAERQESSR